MCAFAFSSFKRKIIYALPVNFRNVGQVKNITLGNWKPFLFQLFLKRTAQIIHNLKVCVKKSLNRKKSYAYCTCQIIAFFIHCNCMSENACLFIFVSDPTYSKSSNSVRVCPKNNLHCVKLHCLRLILFTKGSKNFRNLHYCE